MLEDTQQNDIDLEERDADTANSGSSETKTAEEEPALPLPEDIQELLKKGLQFGHAKRFVHPSMLPFIASVRNDVHIIDVGKTVEFLKRAKDFVEQKAADGRLILFVGTKAPLRELVRKAAEESGMPFIVEHWAGGTLTNWKTISLRFERLHEIQDLKKSGEFVKYPKQEQSLMQQELQKLETQWGGVADLKRTPDVVIVTDMQQDNLAVQEARKMGISVVGITDTNVNSALATHAIPANDDSIAAVEYILGELKDGIVEGKRQAVAKNEASKTEQPAME